MRPNVQSAGSSSDAPSNSDVDFSNVAIIIPARMASSRLPQKPLALIDGIPMIVHVMRRAHEAGFGEAGFAESGQVVVACDDEAIADAVSAHGGRGVLTSPEHPSGSDRVFEALEMIDPEQKIDVVVNLQGDLPEIDANILRPLVAALRNTSADVSTPIVRANDDEKSRSQVVKAAVAFDSPPCIGMAGRILYFSRHPIPHGGGTEECPIWHHIGIYAWRREALKRFVGLPPSLLEQAENLEQLRALEDGMTLVGLVVDTAPAGIDTPEDLEGVCKRMMNRKH